MDSGGRGRARPRHLATASAALALVLGAGATQMAFGDASSDRPRDWGQPSAAPPKVDDPRLRALQQEELALLAARERTRKSPAGRADRLRSRTAHAGGGADAAIRLARRSFAEVFDHPLWSKPTPRAGERVTRYVGTSGYMVEGADGRQSLVESALPVRATDASGKRALIDTELRAEGAELVPVNSPARTRIARRLAGGVSLERAGVRMHLEGARAVDATVLDDKAIFTNALIDSDFAVAALPTGVETFLQLRSEASPEAHRLRFELPAGARLQIRDESGAVTPAPPRPGAQIVRGDEVLATIAPARAVDADGRSVAASYAIDGDTLVVRAAHRDGDHAYPILVDPYVEENFPFKSQGADLDRWGFGWSQEGFIGHNCTWNQGCWASPGINGRGLYVEATPRGYAQDTRGEWYWQAPRGSSIVRVNWNNYGHIAGNSCVYGYISGNGGGAVGSVLYRCDSTPGGDSYFTSCANHPTCGAAENRSNWAQFGLIMYNGTFWSAWSYIGNPQIYLWEGDRPTVTRISPETPGDWVDRHQGSFKTWVTDRGLGVKKAIFGAPNQTNQERELTCTGGRYSTCPEGETQLPRDGDPAGNFTYDTTNWSEGSNLVEVIGADVIGNGHDNPPFQRWIKVDHTDPVVTNMSGTLKNPGTRFLTLPDYSLHVDATDPRSGVRRIDIEVVNPTTNAVERSFPDPSPQGCTQGGCSKSRDWNFHSDDYSEGRHKVRVIARDGVGRTDVEEFTVDVDRRDPAIVAHDDFRGLDGEYVGPDQLHDLVLDATDDGSGVNRVVVDEVGRGEIASRTAPECSTRCPQAFAPVLEINTTTLTTEGERTFVAKAIDDAGRVASDTTWKVFVDRTPPAPPANLDLEYDIEEDLAALAFDEGSDPDLPDGNPGSQVEAEQFRYKTLPLGEWSEWETVTGIDDEEALVAAGLGDIVEVEMKSIDGADNQSATTNQLIVVKPSTSNPPVLLEEAATPPVEPMGDQDGNVGTTIANEPRERRPCYYNSDPGAGFPWPYNLRDYKQARRGGRNQPDCRKAVGKTVDTRRYTSQYNRTPRDPMTGYDHFKPYGVGRRIEPNGDGMVSIYNSYGQVFAFLSQRQGVDSRGRTRWTIWRAPHVAGEPTVRLGNVTSSKVELRIQGRGCVIPTTEQERYAIVVLNGAGYGTRPGRDRRRHYLGIRGFMRQDDMHQSGLANEKALKRYPNDRVGNSIPTGTLLNKFQVGCVHRDIGLFSAQTPQNAGQPTDPLNPELARFPWWYHPIGERTPYASTRKLRGNRFTNYLGFDNPLTRSTRSGTFGFDGSRVTQVKVNANTTAVAGGGIVRAIVPLTRRAQFSVVDYFGYTDSNQECLNERRPNTHRTAGARVARWVYVRSADLEGFLPMKEPGTYDTTWCDP